MKIDNIIPYFIIIVMSIIIYGYVTEEPEVIEVPIEIKVPVPSIEHFYDTIYMPDPLVKYTVDSLVIVNKKLAAKNDSLFNKYTISNDSIKYELYKEAISIRDYKEIYIDTFQTIHVSTTTRGEILNQSVEYKTNPFNITIDTTVEMLNKVNKRMLMGEIEAGYGVFSEQPLVIKSGISLISRSSIYGVSVDTEGRGWFKFGIKF